MVRLVVLGLVAAFFFSSTFVLNRAMSLEGGHWVWTASLRYGYMFLLLCLWLIIRTGIKSLKSVAEVFLSHWRFWLLAGTVGFGLFYAPLCYAAAYVPAWVVASTWQFTIVATPLVLLLFNKRVPKKAILLSLLIFFGILLVNIEQAKTVGVYQILLGVVPVLLAAFAYPIGNQMVGEAKQGGYKWIPDIRHPIMQSAPARILLLTIGSVPFWIVLTLAEMPPAPSKGQLFNTGLVALSSGVIATSVFLHARHSTNKPYEIAAIDATQSGETIFSLTGEIVLLSGALPMLTGWLGLLLIVVGIVLYTVEQRTTSEA